ncbi:MAG: peptidoglycan-associated lipoprotein Pal [Alphaproteobacteria bacterium]
MKMRLLSVLAVLLVVTGCAGLRDGSVLRTADGRIIKAGTAEDFAARAQDRVFFSFDRYSLDSKAKTALKTQAEWLAKYADKKVTVEGHADERGTREYNIALGERRANSVKKYLISLGVAADRISTVSYGKERPAVMGSNEAAWAQNRRAVTVVIK